jgi:hypothetical protein
MMRDVVRLVMTACKRFHLPLSLAYFPSAYQQGKFDIYSISIYGKYLLNVTSRNFYDIPLAERLNHFAPLIRAGLAHNIAQRSLKDQVEIPRRHGITLIRNGVPQYGF